MTVRYVLLRRTRMRLRYFERGTPSIGVAARSSGVAIVLQPALVRRWILARLPSCAGSTEPLKRTRAPRRGVLSLSLRPTFVRTSTVTSALVAGGDLATTW